MCRRRLPCVLLATSFCGLRRLPLPGCGLPSLRAEGLGRSGGEQMCPPLPLFMKHALLGEAEAGSPRWKMAPSEPLAKRQADGTVAQGKIRLAFTWQACLWAQSFPGRGSP